MIKTEHAFLVPNLTSTSTLQLKVTLLQAILQGYGFTFKPQAVAALVDDPPTFAQLTQLAQEVGIQGQSYILPFDALFELPLFSAPTLLFSATHSTLLWQQLGPLLQLLTPPQGREWLTRAQFRQTWGTPSYPLSHAEWQQVALTESFQQLRLNWLRELEVEARDIDQLLKTALAEESWRGLATLDAAIRFTTHLAQQRALSYGTESYTAIKGLYEQALTESPTTYQTIPAEYWLIRPNDDQLLFRGVALLVVQSCQLTPQTQLLAEAKPSRQRFADVATQNQAEESSPQNKAILLSRLPQLLQQDGLWSLSIIGVAMLMAALGVVLQALLFRGFMDLGSYLPESSQRATAIGLLFTFATLLLLLEWFIDHALSGLGRRLDVGLRRQILEYLPRVNQSYLQNIATADMMERIYIVRDLHNLPQLGGQLLRLVFQLLLTLLGLAFIAPLILPLAIMKVVLTFLILWQASIFLPRQHWQQRSYLGQLSRFYLDGMMGLIAVQVHQATRALWRAYETLLVRWLRQRFTLSQSEFGVVAIEQLVSTALLTLIILSYIWFDGSLTQLPLVLFWSLQLNILGGQLVFTTLRYLGEQSKKERFNQLVSPSLVTSHSPKNEEQMANDKEPMTAAAIQWQGVNFSPNEQPILRNIDLTIDAGSHVAIVGSSGAGKSTLVKVLLGWHKATSGQIWLDGEPLTPAQLQQLRQTTAWVDPTVQLWNRSLWYNLQYGSDQVPLDILIQQANLRDSLERLPKGLQNELGERGRLLSSGQGQRVRLGRAMQRPKARLAIFDEPFRGLDRPERYNLLQQSRAYWQETTFVCVTHDVSHTLNFDQVIVIEEGQIVECGLPSELAAQPHSRYRALLQAEETLQHELWTATDTPWRRVQLAEGKFTEAVGQVVSRSASQSVSHDETDTLNADRLTSYDADTLTRFAWSPKQLGRGLFTLAQKCGYITEKAMNPNSNEQDIVPEPIGLHLETLAARLGLEAEPVKVNYNQINSFLQSGGPAILQLNNGQILLLVGSNRWWLTLLTPDLTSQRQRITTLSAALRQPLEATLSAQTETLLNHMALPKQTHAATYQALLHEQLKEQEVAGFWLLRPTPAAKFSTQIHQAFLPRYLFMSTWSEALNGFLYLASFIVFGIATTQPHSWSWLVVGLLILLSRAPFELLRYLGEILLSVNLEGLLKQRLFYGILHLHPDKIAPYGTGQFLGWALETERFTIAGRVITLIYGYATSLLITALFLAFGAGGWLHGLLLFMWLIFSGLLTWQTYQSYLDQHQFYLEMSQDLLERIEGHQTRLMQEDPHHWHEAEDEALARYLNLSRIDDRHRTRLTIIVPYGWLVFGLIGLIFPFISQTTANFTLGISFLGVLWAFQQLQLLAPNLLDSIKAIVAWQLLKPIEQPLYELEQPPKAEMAKPILSTPKLGQPILEVQRLTFYYPNRQQPILNDCNLTLYHGDRMLLEGPTGSGKSTLAALLVGLRPMDSGLLLLQGLDHHSLPQTMWRQYITLVPQFQENHVLNTSLAFNLLMGRAWPPEPTDLVEAATVCHELGLGSLLAAMPRGLDELIGESGWQLSQGERGRLFLARAILQKARLIILDETLASLDPENLQTVLQCVQRRAPTLLVIAHP